MNIMLKNKHAYQRGLSLIELMVGMTIGIIALLAIQQMVVVFDKQKRSGTGSADAQNTAMIAIHTLENDIKKSGYGISGLNAYGCIVSSPGLLNGLPLVPFMILPAGLPNPYNIPAGDAGNDMLIIMYGHSQIKAEGDTILSHPTNNTVKVENTAGYAAGDFVLVSGLQPGVPGANRPCFLAQIAGLVNPLNLNINTNWPTTAVDNFLSTDSLLHLGQGGLTVNVYAIRNNTLTVCDYVANDCTAAGNVGNPLIWVPVSANTAILRAQYGWDTNAMVANSTPVTSAFCRDSLAATGAVCPSTGGRNPDLDTGANMPVTPCAWARMTAVRIALGTRSQEPSENGVLVTPAQLKLWPDVAGGATPDTTGPTFNSAATRTFRYKVFNTTIPLRNNLWARGNRSVCP